MGAVTRPDGRAAAAPPGDAGPELGGQRQGRRPAVADRVHDRARELARRRLSRRYCRLKVEAAARRGRRDRPVRLPAGRAGAASCGPPWAEWARGRVEWADPDPTRLMELLGPVDIPYRERRLMFLLAGINALYARSGPSPHAPPRSDLDR